MSLITRPARLLTMVALVAVSFLALTAVATADYPPKVQKKFVHLCTSSAESGGLSHKQAKAYCERALACIEDKIPLKKFGELGANALSNKKVKACVREALQG